MSTEIGNESSTLDDSKKEQEITEHSNPVIDEEQYDSEISSEERLENMQSNVEEEEVEKLSHIEHVKALSLRLFDDTSILHELDDGCRRILEYASMLIEKPVPGGRKKAVTAAKHHVEGIDDDQIGPDEMRVLVAVVALRNRDVKRKRLASLDLEPIQQREALTLSAILRIAVGLNESCTQSTIISQIEPTKGKMWIVVDGPNTAVDIAAAQHKSWLWEKIGYPQIRFLEAQEAKKELLPYPELADQTEIEVGDPMAEAGRKILRFHFARMLNHESGTRLGEDVEELHKMRVATRRMRAAFIVFNDAYQTQTIKYYIKGLRTTGRALGRVRDLDVFLEKANLYLASLTEDQRDGLSPLLRYWNDQRDTARIELVNYLDSDRYQKFKRKFNIFLSTPGAGALPVPRETPYPNRVREIAPLLIYACLADVRAYEPFLVNASIENLHALRIDLKKLRYTIEFFKDVLGPEVELVITEMKNMQDHLGDLNDAQVAAQSIQTFIDGWDIEQEDLPISERQNPEAIVSYMASRHAELHQLSVQFSDAWAHFNRPEFSRNLALSISIL